MTTTIQATNWVQYQQAVNDMYVFLKGNMGTQPKGFRDYLNDLTLTTFISGNELASFWQRMVNWDLTMDTAAAVPGIKAYAANQVGDPAFDVEKEYNAIQAAIVALGTYMIQTFQSHLTEYKQTGVTVEQFNGDDVAPIVPLLDDVITAIETGATAP